MNRNIDTIFFDVGATLRYVVEDEAFAAAADKELMELVGAAESRDVFFEKLTRNWKAYRKWAKDTLLDVSEMELWLQYLLPDYPAERTAPNAARLTRLWRDHDGRRLPHEGVKETLRELKNRGYKLGIISNLIGENEVPDWLEEDGLDRYFDAVVLSSVCGMRKPCFEIYQLAAREMGVELSECVSVADNIKRDIPGAKKAGVGCNIIFSSPEKKHPVEFTEENRPDAVVEDFREILNLLPPLN